MRTVRLLAILEASTITGPAKNLLQFAHERTDDPAVRTEIAVFRREGQSNLFIETAGREGVTVHALREAGRFDRAVIAALRALAAELKPDIVQSHAVKSHFLVRAAGLDRMAPWVAFHHGYTWPDLRARLYNQLDRWSLRAARRAVTMSRPFRRELIRRGVAPERIEIVHNAIDPEWGSRGRRPEAAAALRGELKIAPEARVLLIVGRLSTEKDHRTLMEAVRRLPSAPAAHLVIVGDGPERPRIEESARSLGLAERVTLTGQVDSAEPYYGIADICVLSSLSEGSPNALLEAMAAGVPVVATAVGGIPEIVADGESALLIPPKDPAAMTGAVAALLEDEGLARKLAGRARQLAVERHAPEARARRLVEIYTRLLEDPRAGSAPIK
jgi:glycosyltransferase involved in cell wall biosynthesis